LRIPSAFQLAGATWQVQQVDDLPDLGNCLRDVRKILLRKNQPKEAKYQAFCHELTHAIKFSMGQDNHDETETELFANFLAQFMLTVKYV
jgi:hypothetical protein